MDQPGPDGGYISAIVIDGAYNTTDGGASWKAPGLGWLSVEIMRNVALWPSNPTRNV